jgi:hypothetical protein
MRDTRVNVLRAFGPNDLRLLNLVRRQ